MKNIWIFIVLSIVLNSCKSKSEQADAFGNFESEEVLVSAEANGRILSLPIIEGAVLEKNQVVGIIDTVLPSLQKVEIQAQIDKVNANLANMDAQIAIYNQQKENLNTDKERIENMLNSGASTQKQMDDITGSLQVIDKQIAATNSQKSAIAKELEVIAAKKLLLDEQLNRCRVKNPIAGTVLEKYAEAGEVTAAGKPLYKIANTQELIFRAYVSGSQLANVKLGNTCKVKIDKGIKDFENFDGTITWIASQAEFTPKIIQTKEERVSMVYAVKIVVKNNGAIKIGMPGEVIF